MTPAEINLVLIAVAACPALIFFALATNTNEGASVKRRKNYWFLAVGLGVLAIAALIKMLNDTFM